MPKSRILSELAIRQLAELGEEEVLGLEIAMHDAERVRLGDAGAGLTHVVDGEVDREAPDARELAAEIVADEQLHRDVGLPARKPVDVEDARDVGAPQLRGGACLALEPRRRIPDRPASSGFRTLSARPCRRPTCSAS